MCVDNVVREFLINCKIKEYSPRTIKSYRNNLNLCQRYFYGLGLTELETISAAVIREFILDNQERGCKASYINNLLKTLRAFFTYTIEQEYLQCNPMNKVPWCKEKQTLISVFNSSDVSKMLNVYSEKSYMDMRNKTILTLLFDTGIRCFELCSITNDSIQDTYIKILGKGNKERIVPISPLLQKRLYKYNRMKSDYFRSNNTKCDNYFLSRTGKPLTNAAVERIIRNAGESADINDIIRCSPHTCRHWFAQTQIKNGLDIYTLSRLLGHTNIKITQIYLNSMQDYVLSGFVSITILSSTIF